MPKLNGHLKLSGLKDNLSEPIQQFRLCHFLPVETNLCLVLLTVTLIALTTTLTLPRLGQILVSRFIECCSQRQWCENNCKKNITRAQLGCRLDYGQDDLIYSSYLMLVYRPQHRWQVLCDKLEVGLQLWDSAASCYGLYREDSRRRRVGGNRCGGQRRRLWTKPCGTSAMFQPLCGHI